MHDTPRRSAGAGALGRGVALLVLSAVGSGCAVVSYRHDDPAGARPAQRTQTMYYRVRPLQGISMGGVDEIKRAMKRNEVFARSEMGDAPTSRGVSIDVNAMWIPPSIPAMVYGYVDVGLLGLLPLYSDSMGYDVQYTVYLDGRKIRIYEYPIRRNVFMWLPVLPFVWINLLTESESDAFAGVTRRFFSDASRDGAFDGRDALPGAP
ncbi:MAG TPA: hypothetical protein VF400_11030 [Anaeromyxobacteraceae bacterium]